MADWSLTHIIFFIFIMILLIYYLAKWLESPPSDNEINPLEKKVEDILTKKRKKNLHTTVETCRNSLVQACLITFSTTGDPLAAMSAGLASGIVGGLIHHIKND